MAGVLIPRTSTGWGTERPAATGPLTDWRAILAEAVGNPAELCRRLGLPPRLAAEAAEAARQFPLLVPRTYLARIRPGDPADPLLTQVLPRKEELAEFPQFSRDPLGESAAGCAAGLLVKYKRRALIVASGTCGVHCRFCFRRHFPYRQLPDGDGSGDTWQARDQRSAVREQLNSPLTPHPSPHAPHPTPLFPHWPTVLQCIAEEPSIEEVILSGGDPLCIEDARLGRLFSHLSEITHVRRLRLHTRLPIVVPQRVTGELLATLRCTRLAPLVVVHANHPAEIDSAVAEALGRLVDAGIPVLNQAVLLRGVNDNTQTLADLCRRLVDLRVMPYYLHQLDRVAGAAHFEVPTLLGIELLRQLRAQLPGYAVPRYVRDTPGAANKEVLA
jgi:L-lysine 2,3-aminomutase